MSALLYLSQASLGKDAMRLGMGLRMGTRQVGKSPVPLELKKKKKQVLLTFNLVCSQVDTCSRHQTPKNFILP